MASNLFLRIVVPTDFSECAERAWAVAQRVAGTLRSEVVLAHILVEPIVYGDPTLAADSTLQLFEQGRKWVEDELEKWAVSTLVNKADNNGPELLDRVPVPSP